MSKLTKVVEKLIARSESAKQSGPRPMQQHQSQGHLLFRCLNSRATIASIAAKRGIGDEIAHFQECSLRAACQRAWVETKGDAITATEWVTFGGIAPKHSTLSRYQQAIT